MSETAAKPARRMLDVFANRPLSPPPVWLMRQAGRYLAEYRAVREKAGGFLNLCYTPELALEVTLQPIRRYGFDAAILFSDILVVPHALGQELWFAEGEGPRLTPVTNREGVATLAMDKTGKTFASINESVRLIRAALPDDTALIGFCGAPWTVATYSVAGRGSPDQAAARRWAYEDPSGFQLLIDTLTQASIDYLSGQITAGADLIQIFDTWAGALPDDQFERWVVEPTKTMVAEIKRRHPGTPIIGFPRGAGMNVIHYIHATGVDGVGCDTAMPLAAMAGPIADTGVVVQGNLDPLLLVEGGDPMLRRIDEIVAAMDGKPFIFNLGHGIVPQTPPDNVAALMARLRGIT